MFDVSYSSLMGLRKKIWNKMFYSVFNTYLAKHYIDWVDEFFLIMTLIYLPFNAYKLNLRFYDKWTIIRKTFSPVPFLGNFWNFYNNSYNRLKYVFEQIISIAAIENL